MAAGAPGMSNLTSFTSVFQLPASRLIGPVAGPAVAPASAVAVPSALPASSDLPQPARARPTPSAATVANLFIHRSEEHTPELQSVLGITSAVVCLTQSTKLNINQHNNT